MKQPQGFARCGDLGDLHLLRCEKSVTIWDSGLFGDQCADAAGKQQKLHLEPSKSSS
jgi:hypothetical protein